MMKLHPEICTSRLKEKRGSFAPRASNFLQIWLLKLGYCSEAVVERNYRRQEAEKERTSTPNIKSCWRKYASNTNEREKIDCMNSISYMTCWKLVLALSKWSGTSRSCDSLDKGSSRGKSGTSAGHHSECTLADVRA